jgi:UDP-galactopyranose mutase
MEENYDVLIVGAGLSGSVIAREFAELGKKSLIIDKREHLGGNCYDYIDENNILVNKYGAHIFHTNNENVWNYINKFSKWIKYEHKVYGNIENNLVPIPVNINTVNLLCKEHIKNEEEMNKWLLKNQINYDKINNSEEMALSRVGQTLYEKIFKNYTYKQWAKYPNELNCEVLARIPVRNNFDDRYFTDKYQALPQKGYTHFINELLNHKCINILLSTDYFEYKLKNNIRKFKHVIYTGPIDSYFSNYGYEKLEYRSINFIKENYQNLDYYQKYAVINYPSLDVEFTRIVEYKHFLNQVSQNTTIIKEYTCNNGEPYYPVLTKRNIELYSIYQKLAQQELKNNIHFIGRLANYKYFNMDEAINNSLIYFDNTFRENN